MDLAFWRERWATGQIGFHEGKPNAQLSAHVDRLPAGARVLVPLAGKSADLQHLAERGHDVVGVEAVEEACRAFFAERGLAARERASPPFRVIEADGSRVAMWCGDMFEATPARLGMFGAAYDRAALVALAPADRARYVETLAALLEPGAALLLVTLAYEQARAPGPPWSAPPDEVRRLFAPAFSCELLGTRHTEPNPRMTEAGIPHLEESALLLVRATP